MITSLGRTASPSSLCRAEWSRRALATKPYIPPRFSRKEHRRKGNVDTGTDPSSIFVRPWDGVPNMIDGFAMLRGIEKKYGKIKAFRFMRDEEIPSTYFSYFWVELEDPSRYPGTSTAVLRVPIPEAERDRPGGVGISDLQSFLRPPPESQEGTQQESVQQDGTQEWAGVTERMVDEVDESKRENKVYDLRLEPSHYRTQAPDTRYQSHFTEAFIRWGGFSSPSSRETTNSSITPTLDNLLEPGSQPVEAENPAAPVEEEAPPPPPEEPFKPFNHEFDEPVRFKESETPVHSRATATPSKPQPLWARQRDGKPLSNKQKALLQAAAISRTPLPSLKEEPLARAKQAEADSGPKMETEEEKKQFQNKIWDLVKRKWF